MKHNLFVGYTPSNKRTAKEVCNVLGDMKLSVYSESLDEEQALMEETKTAIVQSEKVLLMGDAKSKILTQTILYVSKTRDNGSIFLYVDTKALSLSLKFFIGKMNVIDSSEGMWQSLIYRMFGDDISALLSEAKELHIVEKRGLYGFADEDERILIPCQWIGCGIFSEGLAPVQLTDNMWGYIDIQGRLAIPYKLKNARPFMKGYGIAVVQNRMGKWVYMDKDGAMDESCTDNDSFGTLSPESMEANYAVSMEMEEDLAGII